VGGESWWEGKVAVITDSPVVVDESGSMTSGLHRYQKAGDLHFVTFSCYHRQPKLGTSAARAAFERSLEQTRRAYSFCVAGYVVMPENVHLLLTEPLEKPLSTAVPVEFRICCFVLCAISIPLSISSHKNWSSGARWSVSCAFVAVMGYVSWQAIHAHQRVSSTRAYIFPTHIEWSDNDSNIQSTFKNTGSSPAIDIHANNRTLTGPVDGDISQMDPHFTQPEISSISTLPPSGVYYLKAPTGTAEEVAKVKSGDLSLWLFLQFQFKDAEGNLYEPRFCYRWSPKDEDFTVCPQNAWVLAQSP
jgi:REP element-mobilizing transposase RayT